MYKHLENPGKIIVRMVIGLTILYMSRSSFANDKTKPKRTDKKAQLTFFSFKRKAPLIDGKLDDVCWKDSQKAVGFMPLGKIEPVEIKTEVISCYDDRNLYLAAIAYEPEMKNINTTDAVWNGDSFEIFISPFPEDSIYYQFLVSADGDYMVYKHTSSGASKVDLKINLKTHKADDYWSLEMVIPFSALNCKLPEDNQRWAFNIGRNRRVSMKKPQHFTWAYLGTWTEWSRLGGLAFYSRAEIDADMEYWRNPDIDPLMRRKEVSGYKIASEFSAKREPDLWSYYPFEAERGTAHKNGYFYGAGLPVKSEKEHPEFFNAAMGINRLLLDKTSTDEKLSHLKRILFYAEHCQGGKKVDSEAEKVLSTLDKNSEDINNTLNKAFQFYGKAYSAGKDKEKLTGITTRLKNIKDSLDAQNSTIDSMMNAITARMKKTIPWQARNLRFKDNRKVFNARGLNTRLQYVWYSFIKDRDKLISPLIPTYDSTRIDWPGTIPEGKKKYEKSFSEWNFDRFRRGIHKIKNMTPVEIGVNPTLAVHQFPACKELIDAIINEPDIIDTSYDGHTYKYKSGYWRVFGSVGGLNYNNPTYLELVEHYISAFAKVLREMKVQPAFILSAWEGNYLFYIELKDQKKKGYRQKRLPGYNPSQKQAFRDYLLERYVTIEHLNQKWKTDYPSFKKIEPPIDKNIKPAVKASGLTYEFERFMRVNYVRYQAKLKTLYHKYIPGSKVLPDPSKFLSEMNSYLMYKENAADYMSFHTNPGHDEVLWTYFSTMNRVFGNITGIYEHYHGMYSRVHLNDERLGKRDLNKMFFSMFMKDVRLSTWWLAEMAHPTVYVSAYNSNVCYLDYNQTIYRWSITILPRMFERGRNIEKALLGSKQEVPVTAIIQPCATVYNIASMGEDYKSSPTIQMMFDLHSSVLRPKNFAHDFLPEEMVLDNFLSLENYKLLFLPYAPYMSEEFSVKLQKWVENGGTLIAFGPFGLMNPYGVDMPKEKSLFKKLFPHYKKIGNNYFDYTVENRTQRFIKVKGSNRTIPIGFKPDDPSIIKHSYGKGAVIQMNRMSSVYTQDLSLRNQLEKELAALNYLKTADSTQTDLNIMIRDIENSKDLYLCVCNENIKKPVTADITVKGEFKQALDITVSGWFPVPITSSNDTSIVKIHLDPSEWTMIRLIK